jgi:hypothetical protein
MQYMTPHVQCTVLTLSYPITTKIYNSTAGLWIRIRIGSGFGDFVDPDPYWESGSRGKKTKKFQWKNALFSYLKKTIYH